MEIKIPKQFSFILNQLFEIENKLKNIIEPNTIQRNLDRMKDYFENDALGDGQGILYHNPLGESYSETRTDCEANISGSSHENLEIIEVIRPIIYAKIGNSKMVIQKAIVIVQSKDTK